MADPAEVHAHRTSGARRFVDMATRLSYGILPTQLVFKRDRINDATAYTENARENLKTMRGAAIGVEDVALVGLGAEAAHAMGASIPLVDYKTALWAGAGYLGTKIYSSAVRWLAGRGHPAQPGNTP